jgi:hypothetical protein
MRASQSSRRPVALVLAAVLLAGILPLLALFPAHAHPLGNFTINRYARLELYQGAVHVHYVVDSAEIPTYQLIGDIDSDRDGTASQAELDAYAAKERFRLAANLSLSVNGSRIDFAAAQATAQLAEGQAGLKTLRLVVVYVASLAPNAQAEQVVFSDSNYNDRAGWKEIVVRPSEGSQVSLDPKLMIDTSDALRTYPAETLSSAPDMRTVRFGWAPASGQQPPAENSAQAAAPARAASGVAGVFSDLLSHDRSIGFLLASLLVAFLFGAQHALGPGHGKTMVAAYLVGSKGTAKQAVVLGFTVTATHTSTVYLMGFLALWAASYVATETVQLWMGVIVGILVVGFGATLFVNRLRTSRGATASEHRHGLFILTAIPTYIMRSRAFRCRLPRVAAWGGAAFSASAFLAGCYPARLRWSSCSGQFRRAKCCWGCCSSLPSASGWRSSSRQSA